MSIISLVIAPTLAKIHHNSIIKNRQIKMENLMLLNNNEAKQNQQNVWSLESNNAVNRGTIEKDVTKLIDALQQANLINKSTYSVAANNNWLYIDGVKQPAEVNDRYSKYFAGKGDFVTKQSRQ